ncbi:MAG: helix-turn-helix transcriptional regulator [Marmoricola sp.]
MGADLTAWRRLQRLTVDEVADRAGVSSRTVSRLEDGEGATLENLMRIARALGVLDALARSVDPYSNDVGRLRADESLPQRVRRPSRPGPAGTRADKDQS